MSRNPSKLRTVFLIMSLFFIAVSVLYGTYLTVRYFTYSQTCMTVQQVQSDSRCLYILSGKIYQKGSRSKPHQGNPCGTDVTSIIRSFHTASPAKYLDPNYVGNICTNQPAATNTPVPQATATSVPQPTSTSCTLHSKGDTNCDGTVDITDYEIFRKELLKQLSTVSADFDGDGAVTVSDFEIWRKKFNNTL